MASNSSRKKILFFVPTFPVLSETFIERELCELKKRDKLGLQIVSLDKSTNLNCKDLENSISYLKLRPLDILVGLVRFAIKNPVGVWRTRMISLGNKNKNFFGNLYLWVKSIGYAKLFSKFNFDRLHAHFLSEPSTIALYVSILLDVPLSISGHARDVFGKTGVPELIREKLKRADFAAVCNEKAYAQCVNLAAPRDKKKVHLIYHGVEVASINSVDLSNEVKNPVPEIFYVGRFVEKKGVEYLLKAARILKDRGEVFRLLLAGYGPLYQDLKKTSTEMGTTEEVSFLNEGKGVDNKTVMEIAKKCDLLVVPSINLESGDSDGIPNIILEAGMYSKPIVTTDAGSIKEVIKDGETGLVVTQKDSAALADGITKILRDSQLAEKLGSNLYQLVKQNFDLKQNIIELEKLLLK